MAARLATTGQVSRARATIAALPSGAPVVIEVNETVPLERHPSPDRVSTRRIPYVPLADESDAWVAEYRAAREAGR
jgi:hypothetical protein